MSVTLGLTAKPVGQFSLAGAQMKVSAKASAILSCAACGWYVSGRLENAEHQGGVFTGGSFVAESAPTVPYPHDRGNQQ